MIQFTRQYGEAQGDVLPRLRTMTSDNDLFSELYGTLGWNDGTEQLCGEWICHLPSHAC